MGGERLRHNNVKNFREQLLMSKAELARKAGVSPLTIDRIEKGKECRMDTKRKILFALGLDLDEKEKVFTSSSG
ncbi:MAG: helix-turn-helix domain-containing protein [Candidatus Dadabacteria bacterium]|nr:helix-turn-helix domain-containing protein [Candidatus Dadabacteria bacterium]